MKIDSKSQKREKRAFSTQQFRGKEWTFGDKKLSSHLLSALRDGRHVNVATKQLTHGFHSYPARMHPGTARRLLQLVDKKQSLLDPFCGSGTTLVEARNKNIEAVGSDINPLAVEIAKTKIWCPAKQLQSAFFDSALSITDTVREQGRNRTAKYPLLNKNLRTKAQLDRLRGSFDPHVRRELETLLHQIHLLESNLIKPHLLTILSSCLYKVSRRTSDSKPELTARKIARGAATKLFIDRCQQLMDGWSQFPSLRQKEPPHVVMGNALRLPPEWNGKFSWIITSPPYLGTYNYLEHHQLRLDFLGMPSQKFADQEIGARRDSNKSIKPSHVRRKWMRQLVAAIQSCGKALQKSGKIILVIGDSASGGTAIDASLVVEKATSKGFRIIAHAAEQRPLMSTMERNAFTDTTKREHILLLEKVEEAKAPVVED